MEIISYVGGRPDNRQRNINLNFSTITKKLKKQVARKRPMAAKVAVKKPFSPSLSLDFTKISLKLKKLSVFATKTWWILPFAAFLCCIPVGIYKAAVKIESRANPLVLETEGSAEIDILNREMARFAMTSGADVEDDGSIKGALISYNFKEPVTFTDYTVVKGDTISGITKKFNLNNISTIIAVNKIDNVRALNAGKKLRIPSVDGLIHKVCAGESVQSIGKKYSIDVIDILDVNDLDTETLSVGQDLFIPGAKLDKNVLRQAMGDTFINPLKTGSYRLTSRCGWRADPFTGVKQYHPGIDMAITQGTSIYAALSGKVVACGWSNVYGNYAIIDHGNGYQSLYGHMQKKLCTLNQEVSTGTKIGLVGSTGYSTGPHLHFTVYKNGKVVDPLTLIK